MSPILGRYGPFFLTNYFVVLAVGILMALAVTAAFSRRLHLPGWIDGVLLGGGAALVAGRVVYVLLNQDYFIEMGPRYRYYLAPMYSFCRFGSRKMMC